VDRARSTAALCVAGRRHRHTSLPQEEHSFTFVSSNSFTSTTASTVTAQEELNIGDATSLNTACIFGINRRRT